MLAKLYLELPKPQSLVLVLHVAERHPTFLLSILNVFYLSLRQAHRGLNYQLTLMLSQKELHQV